MGMFSRKMLLLSFCCVYLFFHGAKQDYSALTTALVGI